MRATRGKTKAQYRQMWVERIELFHQSGLTQNQFAENIAVSVKSLQYWIKQLKSPQSVPVQIVPAQSTAVKIRFNQLELMFEQQPDPQWLAALIRDLHRV